MTLAEQYAKALWEVVQKNPSGAKTHLANLQGALKRRGHEKLLPNIFNAYENLELREERRNRQSRETPESRRTRTLVELYKKLITV